MEDDIAHLGLLEDEAIVLDAAALELAAMDHPEVELQQYADLLGEMTEALADAAGASASSQEHARALAEVIAGSYGFGGDQLTYDHPDNADLIRVIDRRRGLPVSLTILYVAAARRLGWTADALNTPGHVLARVGPETEPVLIDPFNGGRVVGPDALSALLRNMLGQGAEPAPEHLEPMSNRSVLVRLLMNQASRAEQQGNGDRALTLYRRMTLMAPAYAHGWWEHARLQVLAGDAAGARSSLSAMLEVTRDPSVRIHIYAALDALSSASG